MSVSKNMPVPPLPQCLHDFGLGGVARGRRRRLPLFGPFRGLDEPQRSIAHFGHKADPVVELPALQAVGRFEELLSPHVKREPLVVKIVQDLVRAAVPGKNE
jgi:hypothetical protein